MLQQTQIATALPYYERWMRRFPTVQALADADIQEAMSLWQGLGYYRRCRMLKEGAEKVAAEGTPKSRDEWRKIPGVGDYTAAAIASICYGEPSSVVDGNVERVYARLTCDPATGSALKSNAWKWADRHLYTPEPGEWNQAVMELGATVCKPNQPLCRECPIHESCVAFQTNRVDEFPTPKPRAKTVHIEEEIWILQVEERIAVASHHTFDWWKDLRLLPISRPDRPLELGLWGESLGVISYTVTHHRVTALVNFARLDQEIDGFEWIERNNIGEVPLPAPHRKALALLYKT